MPFMSGIEMSSSTTSQSDSRTMVTASAPDPGHGERFRLASLTYSRGATLAVSLNESASTFAERRRHAKQNSGSCGELYFRCYMGK